MTSAMSDSPPATPAGSPERKSPVLSWEIVILLLLFFALATVQLSRPTGSLSGRIAMEQDGFNLYSYSMKDNKVYAIAIGPREGQEQERGVWVDKDGRFKINNLPVGEYSLRVKVPGFSTAYESGIFIKDGQTTEMSSEVSLEISHPSVSIASNRHVFTSKECPSFWVSASDATAVRARVYRKDLLSVVNMKSDNNGQDVLGVEISPELTVYKPYNATDRTYEMFGKMKPVHEWRRPVKPDSEDWSHEDFAFDKPLTPGDYFAVVEAANVKGETDWGLVWFSVTDMGLIVKQDPDKVVVRAIDLNTLKPIKDVDIQMLNRVSPTPHTVVPRGKYKTGADGFITMNIPEADKNWLSGTLMVCGFQGQSHAYGGMSAYNNDNDKHKTYFYTDRPVYRLGQTIYFKGIERTSTPDGFTSRTGNTEVQVKFEDPDNQEVWNGKIKTTSFGTFNGLLSIPKEGKTGAYQITLTYADGTTSYERVEIDQYRKPEYKVEVIPLEERVSAGGKAKARVRASYYFGAPVAHAKVKYSIYASTDYSSRYRLKPRPEYYSYFDDWDSDSEQDSYSGGGEYVTEGYVETDDSGEAIVTFDTQPVKSVPDAVFTDAFVDRRYKIDVEVTDISRLSVLSSGGVNVTAGDFAVFVDPSGYVVNAGQPISANFTTVDYSGQPMNHVPVRLQLLRRVWDRQKHEYKGVQVFEERTVNTDAKGIGHVDFETLAKYETDTYYIVAQAKDTTGHNIASVDSLWVASENYPYILSSDEAKKEPLQVKLDKPAYEPGDKAKVMITAPVTGKEGAQAIVCLEGPKLYKYQVVDLKATANLVEIPVEKAYAPNVYVTVTFVGAKHQFYNQTQMLKVSPNANFLTLDVKTDKPKYRPGDTVTYTIKATDKGGKPVPRAELSLGVVDESIYAIRGEYVEDIRKAFYKQRANCVNTMCSFPEENSAGPNKIEPKVRKDFKDTAAWFPHLVTNDQGLVSTKVKLPDNLTTWRATVRGVTMDTKVGSTIQKIVSTQDLIVRLALPRFFCQGDEGQISAIVHNYSDQAQDITLSLKASPEFKLLKGLVDKVRVEPEKAARISWPAQIATAGTGVVSVKAVGQTAGDAMEVKLPIQPLGVPVYLCRSGYIDANDTNAPLPFEYPQDASDGSVKTTLSLSSSSLGPVMGNFSSLIDYPYGCTEQTMSKLMPAVVAMKMHYDLGAPLEEKDTEKFQKVYEMAMDKLRSYQHGDGGWGWWPTDTSQMYLTSLVLEGYKLLKDVHYDVSDDETGRAIVWLKQSHEQALKQLTDPLKTKESWRDSELINDIAKSSYALSIYKEKLSPEVKTYMCSEKMRNRLAPECLAYMVMALKNNGDQALAQTLYDRLIFLANVAEDRDGGTMNWDRTDPMYKKLTAGVDKDNYYYYTYRYTAVESSALALRACLAMEPANSPRIESIKRWITLERGKDGWGNTKTTSEVFRAFTEDELARAGRTSDGVVTDFQADIQLAADKVFNFAFGRNSMFKPERTLNLTLKNAQGAPTIHKKGDGRLYWTATMSYYKVLKPGDKTLQEGMPPGLKIRREFLRLVASVPDADGNVKFTQQPIKDGKVKAGETLLMKTFIDSPTRVPYIMMEAALPSGGEVVSSDPRENLSSSDNESTEINVPSDDYGRWWWTHQDVLDDKIAYFVTSLPAGKHEIHTMVRLELPGKLQINPVYLEGMYTNKIRGYSTAGEITVLE